MQIDNLAFSALYITFEQVLRFLMDYIDGDTYYKFKDLGQLLNFNVKWSDGVVIETDKPYTGK